MEAKSLPLKAGWQWFFEGWNLLKNNYIKFLIGTAFWLATELGVAFIPVAGPYIDGFLFPLFYAGFLSFTHEINNDKSASIKHFITPALNPSLLVQFSLLGLVIVVFEVVSVTIATSMSAAIILPLAVVMVSALIFSVPLILFNEIKFQDALISSVQCCGKNFAVIVIMYFILMALMIISAVTYGIALIAIIPLTFCALYTGYCQSYRHLLKGEQD